MTVRARTWLFVPGALPERFDKAAASGAEAVVVDLEDAVTADAKAAARAEVARWLDGHGSAWVRVNGHGTAWHDEDVAALAGLPGLQGVMVPKAEDPAVLSAVAQRLDGRVVALVESARGILAAAELAAAPGVARLAFGSLDYALDIAAEHTDDALLLARSTLVVASRAAQLPAPVDGVTTAAQDTDLVAAEARRARGLGFGGKLCIHPAQLAAAAAAFAPNDAELAWAEQVIAAAEAADGGVVLGPDGQMIDKPVIDRARAIVHS